MLMVNLLSHAQLRTTVVLCTTWVREFRFALFSQQAQCVDAGCADVVHYLSHVFVLGARIRSQKYRLVGGTSGQFVFDLLSERVGWKFIGTEKYLSIPLDCHDKGIFLIGVLHRGGIVN